MFFGFELFVVCRPMVWSVGLGRRRPILLLVVRTLALQALGDVLQFYRSTVVLRSGCEVDFGFKLYVVSGLLQSLSWRGEVRQRPDGPSRPFGGDTTGAPAVASPGGRGLGWCPVGGGGGG